MEAAVTAAAAVMGCSAALGADEAVGLEGLSADWAAEAADDC